MSELDIVRDLARESLTIATVTSELDKSLWDCAQRLVRNTEYICLLPELTGVTVQVDRFCLTAGAYFCDAGLARRIEEGAGSVWFAPSEAESRDLLDLSAQVVAEKLKGIVDASRVDKIGVIITESGDRFTRMTEAMVLSDARNLDDMGAVGIFNESRRYVFDGKGPSDALQSWKNKVDYRYWQARLKEGFRFAPVRRIAELRLAAAECFMNQLKVETEALDLEELAMAPQEAK